MQIKPIFYQPDAQGQPGNGFAYHIGLANENPVNDANKLTIYDGRGGAQTSNPFYMDRLGNPINLNGEKINPWINETVYSVTVISPEGVLQRYFPAVYSDAVVVDEASTKIVDAVVNSLNGTTNGAKVLNLSAYSTIYVQSINSGWEDTAQGPIGGFYAHRDGTVGTPATGTQDKFYDATGIGFSRDSEQRLVADEVTLSIDTSTNTISSISKTTYLDYFSKISSVSTDGDTVVLSSFACSDTTGAVIIEYAGGSADIKSRISAGGNLSGSASPSVDTTYFVFVVSEADGSNPRIAFDTSTTAVNALSEWSTETGNTYNKYRLVDFALTDATPDIIGFSHINDQWHLTDPADDGANIIGATASLLTLTVPIGVRVNPKSYIAFQDSAVTSAYYVIITNPDQTDTAPTASAMTARIDITDGFEPGGQTVSLQSYLTNTSGQLRARSASNGINAVVTTFGWNYQL